MYRGDTREELYRIAASVTVNDVNMEKVTHIVVVDASHTSYKNRNVFYNIFLMGMVIC